MAKWMAIIDFFRVCGINRVNPKRTYRQKAKIDSSRREPGLIREPVGGANRQPLPLNYRLEPSGGTRVTRSASSLAPDLAVRYRNEVKAAGGRGSSPKRLL